MKTDDLVALLSTNPEPVDRGLIVRTLLVALGAGSVLVLGITIFGLGVRPDMMTSGALSFVVAKVSFAVGISSLALVYLAKLARPGGERKPRSYLVAVPFFIIVALAAISLDFRREVAITVEEPTAVAQVMELFAAIDAAQRAGETIAPGEALC